VLDVHAAINGKQKIDKQPTIWARFARYGKLDFFGTDMRKTLGPSNSPFSVVSLRFKPSQAHESTTIFLTKM
jgi:hypothetical protein